MCREDEEDAIREVAEFTPSVRPATPALPAHDGREALAGFGPDQLLDVVVVDISLPDADGRDVVQAS